MVYICEAMMQQQLKLTTMTTTEAKAVINNFLKSGKHEVFKADGFGTRVFKGMQATKTFFTVQNAFNVVFKGSEERDILNPINSEFTTHIIEFGETAAIEFVTERAIYKTQRYRNLSFELRYTYNF